MAQYMSQAAPGDTVWVVYNEYRGAPYRYKQMAIAAVCRSTITTKRGEQKEKVEYMFGDLWKSVPCNRVFPRAEEARETAERLNQKKN